MLDRRVKRLMQDHHIPGVVMGSATTGIPTDVRGVGQPDFAARGTMRPTSQLRLGSITKTFTAALILTLAEEGALDLDDRIERFLPRSPVARPTLRQLLGHHGGVQREVPSDMWSTMQGPDADTLTKSLVNARMVAVPGARWHYSNLGYALLGLVIRDVTGRSSQELIDERFIEPLGLASTTWTPRPEAAVGYRSDLAGGFVPEPVMHQGAVGVGGQLWGTVSDLLTWGRALAGDHPAVVSPSVVQALHTPMVMVDRAGWDRAWGHGLILDRVDGRIISGHTGAMPGFLASVSIDRTSSTVVAALTNVTRGIDLGQVTRTFLVENLELSGPTVGRDEQESSQHSDTVVPTGVVDLLGRWWSEAEQTEFSWSGGAVHACLVESPVASATTFVPESVDVFRAATGRWEGELLHVLRDPDGGITGLSWATYPYSREPR